MASIRSSREFKYRRISHEEWEAVRSDFEDLYLNKRLNYKQISKRLNEHYGFYPTPNQFKKRVTIWKLRKNAKKCTGETETVNNRLLDDDDDNFDQDLNEDNPKSLNKQSSTKQTSSSNTTQSTRPQKQNVITGYTSLSSRNELDDDLESQTFTDLIAAKRDEEVFNVEFLNDHRLKLIVKGSSMWQLPTLYPCISPFPTSNSPKDKFWEPGHTISLATAKRMDAQYTRKFRRLNRMNTEEIVDLTRSMQQIADTYYNHFYEADAEPWYRRVVTAKQRIRTHEPLETLKACMGVINSIYYQHRYVDAYELHEDFNARLQKILPPDNLLLFKSKMKWCILLGRFLKLETQEKELRALLQIRLTTSGPQHRSTLTALRELGMCLRGRSSLEECEALLTISLAGIHAQEQPDLKEWTRSAKMAWKISTDLASTLRRQERFEEACNILVDATQRYGHLPRDHHRWFKFELQKAHILLEMQRYQESEAILSALLQREADSSNSVGPSRVARAEFLLGRNLYHMDQFAEAAMWFEHVFNVRTKMYGLQHELTLDACQFLGACYVEQGLYAEASDFIQRIITDIENEPRRKGNSTPTIEIQELREALSYFEEAEKLANDKKNGSDEEMMKDSTDQESDGTLLDITESESETLKETSDIDLSIPLEDDIISSDYFPLNFEGHDTSMIFLEAYDIESHTWDEMG